MCPKCHSLVCHGPGGVAPWASEVHGRPTLPSWRHHHPKLHVSLWWLACWARHTPNHLVAPSGAHYPPQNTCGLGLTTHGAHKRQQGCCATCSPSAHTLPPGLGVHHWQHPPVCTPHDLTLLAPLDPPNTCCLELTTHGGHNSHQCLCVPLPPGGHTLPLGPGAHYWWHPPGAAQLGSTPWGPLVTHSTCHFGGGTHSAHKSQ